VTVVVGYTPQESGAAALELGVVLARSLEERLVVTTVVALPHLDTRAPVDGDYRRLLRQWGDQALARARGRVPDDVAVTLEVTEATSIAAGLSDAAARHSATLVVLGSSTKGLTGRITLGSVIDSLTHGSRWPLALAPRGYTAADGDRVDRLTVLFSHADSIRAMLPPARDYATAMNVPVRFASLIVRPFKREAGLLEPSADDLVVNAWADRMRRELADVVEQTVGVPGAADRLAVGDGLTWAEAAGDIPWREGDLVLIGAASRAPLARVFLGTRASKIVRSVPVPVLRQPRQASWAFARSALGPRSSPPVQRPFPGLTAARATLGPCTEPRRATSHGPGWSSPPSPSTPPWTPTPPPYDTWSTGWSTEGTRCWCSRPNRAWSRTAAPGWPGCGRRSVPGARSARPWRRSVPTWCTCTPPAGSGGRRSSTHTGSTCRGSWCRPSRCRT